MWNPQFLRSLYAGAAGCLVMTLACGCAKQEPAAPQSKAEKNAAVESDDRSPEQTAPAESDQETRDNGAISQAENHSDSRADDTPSAKSEQATPQAAPGDGVQPASHVATINPPPLGDRSSLAGPAGIAEVQLSESELAENRLLVDSVVPAVELPQLDGTRTKLQNLLGEKCTVLVFWSPAEPYGREQLADLMKDVVTPYADHGAAVVGICVGSEAEQAREAVELAGARYPILHDADGSVLSQFGALQVPRTYLLDADGKILWLDLEYSRSTRRELKSALAYLFDTAPTSANKAVPDGR